MNKNRLGLLVVPILYIVFQTFVLLDSFEMIDQLNNMAVGENMFTLSTNFWQYNLSSSETIRPTLLTTIIWFSAPITSALALSFGYRGGDEEVDKKYRQSMKLQGLIIFVFLEFVAITYANLIQESLSKSIIESFMAMNLYFILPLAALWFFINESISPNLILPKNESKAISIFFLLILFIVYTITLSIGEIEV